MKQEQGRIIKAVASRYTVATENGLRECYARMRVRGALHILVGDRVELHRERDTYVIESVLPRANKLVRPYVANVDVCLIVLAPEPAPDFLLADKIIVNCLKEGIEPVLVWNKSDLETCDLSEYNGVCPVVVCSAESGEGVEAVAELIRGKTSCLAGQSAVGKSSLVNALLQSPVLEVGPLAKKIKRGRHTTRRTEILPLGSDTYIVDTCGFSMLDAVDMPPEELRLYFDDMEAYRKDCRFNTCTHTNEPDCAVKAHLGKGVSEGRYARYLEIYRELDERRKNKYD